MNDEEYGKYLKDKRVILVSHATSLVDSKQAEFIDSYDIVARLNDSVPIPEELKGDIGTRCDILYSSMSPYFRVTCKKLVEPFIDLGVKVICRPTPLKFEFIPKVGGCDVTHWQDKLIKSIGNTDICLRSVKEEPFRSRTIEMEGKIPLTGVAAVWDLLDFDVTEVYMIGFNFFTQGTYEQYAANPKNKEEKEKWEWGTKWTGGHRHSLLPQVINIKQLVKKDNRLKTDETLSTILENTKEDV